jgi:hypothetical protein
VVVDDDVDVDDDVGNDKGIVVVVPTTSSPDLDVETGYVVVRNGVERLGELSLTAIVGVLVTPLSTGDV